MSMVRRTEVSSNIAVRSVVRFLWAKHYNRSEIHRQIVEVYGENAMSRPMIAKWCQMFEDGRTNVTDGPRVGRPSTVNTSDNAGRVNEIILANCHVKIKEIASELNIAYSSASVLIHDQLGYRKVCAHWVPRVLSDMHKNQHFEAALSFLQRYSTDGPQFLSRIITGDESWVQHYTPETKRTSNEWRHKNSPQPKKAKTIPAVQKVMLTVFFDSEGVVYSEFTPRGTTINAASYCNTLKKVTKSD